MRRCSALCSTLGFAALIAASGTVMARPVRVDLAIAPQFANSGELWTVDNDVSLGGDAFVTGTVAFEMNFGGGAASYNFCFAENGFVSFFQAGGSCNSLLPPSGDFIAAFANDLSITEALWSVGSVDTGPAPYDVAEADPAMRFTWRGTDSGGSLLFAQLVLLDQGGGNFNIELNYGGPFATDYVTSSLGGQGLTLGTNTVALQTGAFSGQTTNYFYSLQNGILSGGTPPPPPVSVDEPSGLVTLAGLLFAFSVALRRRRFLPQLPRRLASRA
jgi:hypothetical protein